MQTKNSTTAQTVQAGLTREIGFCDTPIDNRGVQMFQVAAGANAEDALEIARTLSSGIGQLCHNLYEDLNQGGMAYLDGVRALEFLAETVSALVWSLQKPSHLSGGDQ